MRSILLGLVFESAVYFFSIQDLFYLFALKMIDIMRPILLSKVSSAAKKPHRRAELFRVLFNEVTDEVTDQMALIASMMSLVVVPAAV
jgi:hypothetical protein